jgi:hypothetical protein
MPFTVSEPALERFYRGSLRGKKGYVDSTTNVFYFSSRIARTFRKRSFIGIGS